MNRGYKSCWPKILHRGGREGGGGETCVSLVVPDIKCGVIILLFVLISSYMQAVCNISQQTDEFVKDYLISYEKVSIIYYLAC